VWLGTLTVAIEPGAGGRSCCRPFDKERLNGICHDFMMLIPLRGTAATTAAVEQAIRIFRQALGTH
jgi:hypothetical protein